MLTMNFYEHGVNCDYSSSSSSSSSNSNTSDEGENDDSTSNESDVIVNSCLLYYGEFNEIKNYQFIASNQLFSGMNRLRQENKLCDVTLKVNNAEFRAHKNVLSAFSPFFDSMFNGNFKESNESEVTLNYFDSNAFKLIIDFMYTANISLNKYNAEIVLETANFLQIDVLKELCINFFSKNITKNNCLEYVIMSGKYGSEILLKRAIRKIAKHFFIFYFQRDLFEINYHQLKQLLQLIMRKYPENYIMNLIIKWIQNNYDERKNYLNGLLCDYIQSSRITNEQFNKYYEMISEQSDCKKWIKHFENNCYQFKENINIFVFNHLGQYRPWYFKLNTLQCSYRVPNKNMYPGASYTKYNNSILVHGGWKTKSEYVKTSLCYNIFGSRWRKFISMNIPRAYHRTCIINDQLYIIGGGYTTRSINDVEMMDLITGNKMVTGGLINARSSMGIGTYGNSIYAVAGINGEQNLNTIERYDPRENEWCVLPVRCYGYGYCSSAVVLDDVMYCTMGPGKSMDRFDFRMNQWTQIKTQFDKYPNELFNYGDKLLGLFKDNISSYDSFNGTWNQIWQFNSPHIKSDYTLAVAFNINESENE